MSIEKICPYPGLRPFTEEESIFFKGREEHVGQIINLLEEKKFVMLTGASGDGKSSLVYAGVIPNARAGFFKAKYNNWAIADFRPERTPLANCATSLANALGSTDLSDLEKKLGAGYSALIKAYKSSPLYIDTNSEDWKNADDTGKKQLKRKASNLLILVDQFEEFFTNTENFNNGTPSLQSQTVLNLLLETAKIALAEDLPVYIICTMRSDYIGQCASFRGLPEYIGFSQFFVPRLKRKELVQVIEEPALLSGNKISKRLVEVLINELNDGIDQLPVLQHALNQVWKIANEESADMDLIHFAKLSGMPAGQLPPADKEKFDSWFRQLPAFKKEYFKNPSLSNVLDAHANELYETAHIYYAETTGKEISKDEAKNILVNVFRSLTKIDEGRAVRNRSTLLEITEIINDKDVTAEKVNGVVNSFREQGNTFIRPFIPDEKSRKLDPNTVLDITHESLIRNWNLLVEWTRQEETNLQNFHDFKKQVDRWVEKRRLHALSTGGKLKKGISNIWARHKAKTFLLPKGPLAFFDDWFKKANVSPHWLMKYDKSDSPPVEKKCKAESQIAECGEFLLRSKRVFLRKKQWMIASISFSILWTGFWLIVAYLDQKKETENEKVKTEKLKTVMKFDKLAPKVIAPSSMVLTGNEYTADIFLAASSSDFGSLNAKILIGTLDSLDNISNVTDTVPLSKDGVGTYKKIAKKLGTNSYEGVIQLKSPDGTLQNYPFSNEYMVAAPSLMIASDQMNVMYAGVENPVTISVSGVAPSDLVVSVSRGKIKPTSGGHYNMKFDSAGDVQVMVSLASKSGVSSIGPPVTFRIKNIPDPVAFLGDIKGSATVSQQKLAGLRGIETRMEGFDFDLKFRVTSFDALMVNEGKIVTISNNSNGDISPAMKSQFKKLAKGSKIIFSNIKALGADNTTRNLSPIVLELEN